MRENLKNVFIYLDLLKYSPGLLHFPHRDIYENVKVHFFSMIWHQKRAISKISVIPNYKKALKCLLTGSSIIMVGEQQILRIYRCHIRGGNVC